MVETLDLEAVISFFLFFFSFPFRISFFSSQRGIVTHIISSLILVTHWIPITVELVHVRVLPVPTMISCTNNAHWVTTNAT